MRVSTGLVLIFVLVTGTGCATAVSSSSPQRRWIHAHGGCLAEDSVQVARVRRVSAVLFKAIPNDQLEVHVLAGESVGAYAWPTGQIFVTKGLVRLLDDNALRAALAHEIGHLITSNHIGNMALDGAGEFGETEADADRAAIHLLRIAGRDPEDVIRMLQQVASSPKISASRKDRLCWRIALLMNQLGSDI